MTARRGREPSAESCRSGSPPSSVTSDLMRFAVVLALAALAACARNAGAPPATAAAVAALPWDSVVARARGTTVTWLMWRGDPSINAYVDAWVAPRLRERYGVTLN